MLTLTRRPGELLYIKPAEGLDPDLRVRDLFRDGPMVIAVHEITGQQIKVGIQASSSLSIVRGELLIEPAR